MHYYLAPKPNYSAGQGPELYNKIINDLAIEAFMINKDNLGHGITGRKIGRSRSHCYNLCATLTIN